jgi:hypothetical protein
MIVEIPQYIKEVKVSEKRRKKFFKKSSITEENPLPLKYQNSRYVWKKGLLWDLAEEELVVKNSKSAGQPRFIGISGNDIMRMQHARDKIVKAIKENFRPYIADLPKPLPTPLLIELHLYDVPGICNWDLDNKWIYNKCFQDLLQDEGYIPNDNVRYITGSPGVLYHPVEIDDERKLVFILRRDERVIINEHNMFASEKKEPIDLEVTFTNRYTHKFQTAYELIETSGGKAGALWVDNQNKSFIISTGKKKVLYGAARKALGHVYSHCIQFNLSVTVHRSLFAKYQKFFEEELIDRFIQIYIYGRGDEVRGNTQDVRDEVCTEENN